MCAGGVASASEANVQRRERLRQLALDTIDVTQDPYFMKNHLGSYECKLCLTLHTNEGSYMAHTQGKKHQQNLARRAAKLQKDKAIAPVEAATRQVAKKIVKIGRPGYKVRWVTHARARSPSSFFPSLSARAPDAFTMIGMTYRAARLSRLRITTCN